jgi:hypothetical protein
VRKHFVFIENKKVTMRNTHFPIDIFVASPKEQRKKKSKRRGWMNPGFVLPVPGSPDIATLGHLTLEGVKIA